MLACSLVHRWGSHTSTHRLGPWCYTAVLIDRDRGRKGGSSCCLISALHLTDLGLGGALESIRVLARAVLPGQGQEQKS